MKTLISTMALVLILAPAATALADPSTGSGQVLASSPTAAAAPASPTAKAKAPKKAKHTEAAESWTCPMHPEIHEKHAGKCPKCGMDLVREKQAAAAAAKK